MSLIRIVSNISWADLLFHSAIAGLQRINTAGISGIRISIIATPPFWHSRMCLFTENETRAYSSCLFQQSSGPCVSRTSETTGCNTCSSHSYNPNLTSGPSGIGDSRFRVSIQASRFSHDSISPPFSLLHQFASRFSLLQQSASRSFPVPSASSFHALSLLHSSRSLFALVR